MTDLGEFNDVFKKKCAVENSEPSLDSPPLCRCAFKIKNVWVRSRQAQSGVGQRARTPASVHHSFVLGTSDDCCDVHLQGGRPALRELEGN